MKALNIRQPLAWVDRPRREIRRLRSVVVPDVDCLISYLDARRDLSLDGEQWEGATAAINWLLSIIEDIRPNVKAEGVK